MPFTSILFTNIRCNDNENLVAVHVTKLQFCLAESEPGEGREFWTLLICRGLFVFIRLLSFYVF